MRIKRTGACTVPTPTGPIRLDPATEIDCGCLFGVNPNRHGNAFIVMPCTMTCANGAEIQRMMAENGAGTKKPLGILEADAKGLEDMVRRAAARGGR